MRILHVLDHSIPLQSGYTFRTRNILRYQHKLGWQTFQVTGSKQGDCSSLEEQVDGLNFFRTPPATSALAGMPILRQRAVINTLARRMSEVVERVQPDILHAHSPALNGMATMHVARKYRLPMVYECRAFWEDAAVDHGTSSEWGMRYRLTRALESRVFRAADAITTICEGLRSEIVARGNPQEKVTVIPNAVDLDDFPLDSSRDEALAARLGLQGKTVLGFLGSFYAYEGIPMLLEALPAMRQMHPGIALLLVGGGPDEDEIKRRIKVLKLEDTVVLTGRIAHSQVQSYYRLVDILVYPRLPMRLTNLVTPLKPLEAMAQGRLVLASDVGGHRELIEPGKNGYLFPANDVAGLISSLEHVLGERHRWGEVIAAGRKYVESERNWETSVGKYRRVYEALL